MAGTETNDWSLGVRDGGTARFGSAAVAGARENDGSSVLHELGAPSRTAAATAAVRDRLV